MNTIASLHCADLTLTVAGRTLCSGLEFTVKPGEVWGVLGPNGSGKTSLLNVLAGLAQPATGSIALDQLSIASLPVVARARAIGVLPQHEESEFWGTALEYVSLGRFPHESAWMTWQRTDGDDAAHAALASVGIGDFAHRRYSTLSGGERQRVRLAQVLAQAPQFLLLDEPLQHLDLHHQQQVLNLVKGLARDQQRGVVMVLHDVLWPSRICTHALLLDGRGGARTGTAREILTQANLQALFGCALQAVGDSSEAGFVPAI